LPRDAAGWLATDAGNTDSDIVGLAEESRRGGEVQEVMRGEPIEQSPNKRGLLGAVPAGISEVLPAMIV